MSTDDQTTDGPQDHRIKKYVYIGIAAVIFAFFRDRDRMGPTFSLFVILVALIAGFAAWFIEACRGLNLNWLFAISSVWDVLRGVSPAICFCYFRSVKWCVVLA